MTDKEMIAYCMTEFDLMLNDLRAVKYEAPPEAYLYVAQFVDRYRDHLVRASGMSDFPEVPGINKKPIKEVNSDKSRNIRHGRRIGG